VGSHLFAGGDVFVVHAAGFGDDGGFDFGERGVFGGEIVVEAADFLDAPEEIDCGGTCVGEGVADDGDLFCEGVQIFGGAAVDADGYAHGRGDADGGSAADDHVADDGGDLLVVGREDVGLLEGEPGLVEEVNAGREPFEGGNHVLTSLDESGPCVAGALCGARGVEALTAVAAADGPVADDVEDPVELSPVGAAEGGGETLGAGFSV
jgi:hypothetical protein